MLFEDDTTNRMDEAISLFEEICNNRCFSKSSMILFMNKRDLFRIKTHTVSIASVESFKDFKEPFRVSAEGDAYYDAGCRYFLDKFLATNRTERKIYHHITCATDTRNVQVVFKACKDIILRGSLKASGFLD